MQTLKVLSSVSMLLLAVFFGFTFQQPNPLDHQYNAMVQEIMETEGFLSEQETLNQYPELEELKNQIQEIRRLRYAIHQVTQHPIPSEVEENERLLSQIERLKRMNKGVQFQMDQMVAKASWVALEN